MNFGAILLLSLGLAMDATAVAAARGLATPRIRASDVVRVAAFFGGFQALMPLVGWLIGRRVGPLVQAWDHWIVFAVLGAIGGKMLWEVRAAGGEGGAGGAGKASGVECDQRVERDERVEPDLFALRIMFLLALATSIDALAAGFTLPMLNAPILLSLATIGITTAVCSAAGLFAGRRFGGLLGKRLDVAGGLLLIGLGTAFLVQHLRAP